MPTKTIPPKPPPILYGIADTGATTSIIPTSLAANLNLQTITNTNTSRIIWGNNTTEITNKSTKLGPTTPILSKTAAEALISIGDFANLGYNIHLHADGGYMKHNDNNNTIELSRATRKSLWKINLMDISNIEPINQQNYCFQAKLKPASSSIRNQVIDIHNRMGHPSQESMRKALTGPKPSWTHTNIKPEDVYTTFKTYQCIPCTMAKRNHNSITSTTYTTHHTKENTNTTKTEKHKPGEVISYDPKGKISVESLNKEVWIMSFKDTTTGFMHNIPTRSKDMPTTLAAIDSVIAYYKSFNIKPKILRTDDEPTLTNDTIIRHLAEKHQMSMQHSAPYSHWQNSVERDIQTMIKGVTTLLHSQTWLRKDAWNVALKAWTSTRNRTPNVHTGNNTPHRIITKQTVNISNTFLFAFGEIVTTNIPKETREWSFDIRNDIGIYAGHPDGTVDNNYIYWPLTNKIQERASCSKLMISDIQLLKWYEVKHNMTQQRAPYKLVLDNMIDFYTTVTTTTEQGPTNTTTASLQIPLYNHTPITKLKTKRKPETPSPSNMTTRSKPNTENINSADVTNSTTEQHILYAFKARTHDADTPTTKQALKSEHSAQWKEAIKQEMQMLIAGNSLIPTRKEDLPQIYKKIFTTMQLKRKTKPNGTHDKYKARCCARGDMMNDSNIDTYSPTINNLTHNCIYSIAILDNMYTGTIDTTGAYLYQDYPQDVTPLFVTIDDTISDIINHPRGQHYRVGKYIYGLPDAGKAYYDAYAEHLQEHHYTRSKSDPCLFIKISTTETTYIWTHVDDTFIASNNQIAINDFHIIMQKKFKITIEENVTSYLGINIQQLPNGSVILTQPKLLHTIIKEHQHLLPKKPANNPMKAPTTPTKIDTDKPIDTSIYLHLLGSLMYMIKSRPDINTAVSFASTKSKKPTEADYNALLHIVSYLSNTTTLGVIYKRGPSHTKTKLKLTCYVDASYLIHSDSKSHTGYTMSFGNEGTFYTKSSKQKLMATSSTHAEMRALYTLVQDIIYVITLCKEINREIELPAIVFEDNAPVVQITTTLGSKMKRCKHFLMIIHYVKEQVDNNIIKVLKTEAANNTADLQSKPIYGGDFAHKRKLTLG